MNNTLKRFVNGITEIIGSPIKSLITLLPVAACLFAWVYYRHFLVAGILQTLLDYGVSAVAILLSVCILVLIGTPLGIRKSHDNFMCIGFYNRSHETPTLLSKRKDKSIPHAQLWTFESVGIPLEKWCDMQSDFEVIFGVKILSIEQNSNFKKTVVKIVPPKYAKPRLISLDDDFLTDQINGLIVGKTGSGKSYAMLAILGKIANHIPDACITICDYKKSSFAQFEDTPNFYGYEDVPNGIKTFYKEFTERLEVNDEQRNKQIRVLLIDEYGVLISSRGKSEADELKTMVANMLFMGRSLGIRVFIGVQRAEAEYFKSGARDQFRAIFALGNLSKEQKQMLFSSYKDEMTEKNGLGEGYLLIDGQELERVKVAPISDIDKLNDCIRQAMYH